MSTVHVDDAALQQLRSSLATAGEEYLADYNKLTHLVDEIKKGSIQGQVADRMVALYEEKKPTFDGVKDTIEEAKQYMGMKTSSFDTMVNDMTRKELA